MGRFQSFNPVFSKLGLNQLAFESALCICFRCGHMTITNGTSQLGSSYLILRSIDSYVLRFTSSNLEDMFLLSIRTENKTVTFRLVNTSCGIGESKCIWCSDKQSLIKTGIADMFYTPNLGADES